MSAEKTAVALEPEGYHYRRQASIVYRQPAGNPYAEAEFGVWAASCDAAERLVEELERLRLEILGLRVVLR
ncbi:hypothetical protein OO006_04260 [Prosthecochloris sp. SCSIO W1101]|uniref:hypothetical protein n=1 Tax=Prosthecochloris sp. SCSIO W1101 TaxID=2992242 RepID=UPI00223D6385|nr:hypothetical protein [Prosthecochloris sp. SCSIO W1101]UZJ42194.1 hypothetical protein OO006_04260 [Prosthecochloris sp. SCSIO W1101]